METRTQLPEIRRRRGISAAQLARSAGVSRQTIYAMEAGDYVPNTSLALALARILEVHVEDLFQLEGEAQAPAKPVTAEVLALGEPLRKGQPVQLCEVGERLDRGAGRTAACHAPPGRRRADRASAARGTGQRPRFSRRWIGRQETLDRRVRSRHRSAGPSPFENRGIELIVASSSSRQSLTWLKERFVHIAGSHLRDASTGDYNLAAVRKLFPRGGVKVVTFAIPGAGTCVRRR